MESSKKSELNVRRVNTESHQENEQVHISSMNSDQIDLSFLQLSLRVSTMELGIMEKSYLQAKTAQDKFDQGEISEQEFLKQSANAIQDFRYLYPGESSKLYRSVSGISEIELEVHSWMSKDFSILSYLSFEQLQKVGEFVENLYKSAHLSVEFRIEFLKAYTPLYASFVAKG